MICKCPNCNGALKYNPTDRKMACHYCGGVFSVPASVQQPTINKATFQESADLSLSETAEENTDTLSYHVYSCTACGGELAVNDVEASTFCPYCGQPTIVFQRISQELRPNRILPFKLSKEQVANHVREHFGKITYAVDEIKNFNLEKIRGIYIPFWIYDVYYHDTRTYVGMKKYSSDNTEKATFIREAECYFSEIIVDASSALDNSETQLLAPFYFEELRPFQPEYLSGFYADISDETNKSLTEAAFAQADLLFSQELVKSIGEDGGIMLYKKESNPNAEIRKAEYVLLPVWFLTFRYKDEPYTILVNGQTGKIVGLAPFDKKKFWNTFIKYTLGIGIPSSILVILLTILGFDSINDLLSIAGFIALPIGIIGIVRYVFLIRSFKKQKKDVVDKFVKERQEEI